MPKTEPKTPEVWADEIICAAAPGFSFSEIVDLVRRIRQQAFDEARDEIAKVRTHSEAWERIQALCAEES
jgi:hypothetical protein